MYPSRCENQLNISLALYLSTIRPTFGFVSNTRFEPTKFIPGYLGMKIRVVLVCKTSIYVLLQATSDKLCSFSLCLVII